MKIIGIIPARMESTRLPGKPLIKLGNKSMIQRVYESAIKCGQLNDLFVATPNDEIYDHVSNFGKAILTSNNPINGTERVYEAYKKIDHKYDFIINISEDAWFGGSTGPHQHFAKSIFRSIESGVYTIRSANKGISAFISPEGKILKSLQPDEIGNIELNIPMIENIEKGIKKD